MVYGSLLYLLAFAMLPNSPADNMSTIWQDIQAVYREYDIPCRFFYLNTVRIFLKGNNTVKLRGKGAQTRYLYRPMLILWSKYMNNGIQIHKKIKLALKLTALLKICSLSTKGTLLCRRSRRGSSKRRSQATCCCSLRSNSISTTTTPVITLHSSG